jgi:hypothetical protein
MYGMKQAQGPTFDILPFETRDDDRPILFCVVICRRIDYQTFWVFVCVSRILTL